MSKMNVAELVIEALYDAGVRRIYAVAGDSLNAVTEALRKHGGIDWVHTRHEKVAAWSSRKDGASGISYRVSHAGT